MTICASLKRWCQDRTRRGGVVALQSGHNYIGLICKGNFKQQGRSV